MTLRRPRAAVLLIASLLTTGAALLGSSTSSAGAEATGDPASGVWPLLPPPEVVRPFAPPTAPWGAGHRGVDLLGYAGQQVRTALPGRVSYAAPLAGRGVVVVDHGPTRTTYEPVEATVRPGQVVVAGERVGTLTLPGSHCLPRSCLHWGWLRGPVYLDPLALVSPGPVRLLPLDGSDGVPRVLQRPLAAVTTRPPTGLWGPGDSAPAWTRWSQARGWACW